MRYFCDEKRPISIHLLVWRVWCRQLWNFTWLFFLLRKKDMQQTPPVLLPVPSPKKGGLCQVDNRHKTFVTSKHKFWNTPWLKKGLQLPVQKRRNYLEQPKVCDIHFTYKNWGTIYNTTPYIAYFDVSDYYSQSCKLRFISDEMAEIFWFDTPKTKKPSETFQLKFWLF